MAIQKLLRYGTWSGPGWTAGLPADLFSGAGLARTLDNTDRAVDGIDRYDNFVAKAHDINEFDAQAVLRETLGTLSLISNQIGKLPNGRPGYDEALVYGKGGNDVFRFASFYHYRDALLAMSASKTKLRQLTQAFMRYYAHIIYSNLQFAVDCLLNDVNRGRNIARGAHKMGFQLLAAPHWFLGEAHKLELHILRISQETAVDPLSETAIARYLRANLVTPARDYFDVMHGEHHVCALTPDALIGTERTKLIDAFHVLLDAKNAFGRRKAARLLRKAHPDGCPSVGDLMEVYEFDYDPR